MPQLRVTRAAPAAEGIQLMELRHPAGLPLPAFTAGAHVRVTAPNGAVRRFCLCNHPGERDHYEIAVKRDPAGRGGSVSLADDTRPGDLLEVSEPHNAFALVPSSAGYLFLAGGIGIAPIISMLRRVADSGPPFRLYYFARSPAHTAFRDELQRLAVAGKVAIHHDDGDPARFFDLWPLLEKPTREHLYCCGPRPMLEDVHAMTGHWPMSAVHFESFIDAGAGARATDQAFGVKLARSGIEVPVPPGVSILEAIRGRGVEALSSCESGTCGTCKTALLAGEADHRDLVLTDHERASHIMICVSRARSATLTLDR